MSKQPLTISEEAKVSDAYEDGCLPYHTRCDRHLGFLHHSGKIKYTRN